MNTRPLYAAIFWFIITFLFSRIACDAIPGESIKHGCIGAFLGFVYATVVFIVAHVLYARRLKKRLKKFEEE